MGKSLVFVHGFLGRPTDWDPIIPKGLNSICLNLFSPLSHERPPVQSLTGISDWINHKAANVSAPRVLVGYSLGGRLALHSLLKAPRLWAGAVILSAHPGLQTQEGKQKRIQSDRVWAERFEKDQWEKVLEDWNSQAVFIHQGNKVFRNSTHYSKEALAESLNLSSLGLQEDLRIPIGQLRKPILWIVGENDTKFRALAEGWVGDNQILSAIRIEVIPNAGHRVFLDQPEAVSAAITRFLETL